MPVSEFVATYLLRPGRAHKPAYTRASGKRVPARSANAAITLRSFAWRFRYEFKMCNMQDGHDSGEDYDAYSRSDLKIGNYTSSDENTAQCASGTDQDSGLEVNMKIGCYTSSDENTAQCASGTDQDSGLEVNMKIGCYTSSDDNNADAPAESSASFASKFVRKNSRNNMENGVPLPTPRSL
jgi:hypothetical protein